MRIISGPVSAQGHFGSYVSLRFDPLVSTRVTTLLRIPPALTIPRSRRVSPKSTDSLPARVEI